MKDGKIGLKSSAARVLCGVLAVMIVLTPAQAEESESESWSAAGTKAHWTAACGDLIDETGKRKAAADDEAVPEELLTYCEAALAAKLTSELNIALVIVWSLLAAICTLGCTIGKTPFGAAMAAACSGGKWVAAVGDIGAQALQAIRFEIMQESLMQSLPMQAATLGGGLFISSMGSGGGTTKAAEGGTTPAPAAEGTATAPAEGGGAPAGGDAPQTAGGDATSGDSANSGGDSESDGDSCLTLVAAGLQVVMKSCSIVSSDKAYKTNTGLAENLESEDSQATFSWSGTADTTGTATASAGGTSRGVASSSTPTTETAASSPTSLASCSKAVSSGNTSGVLQCAAAHDAGIAKALTPEALEGINKLGIDVGQLAKSVSDGAMTPSQAAASIMGLGNPEATALLQSGLERNIASATGSTYAGGGSARKPSGGSDDDGLTDMMSQMMAGLMGQLNPGDPKAAAGAAEAFLDKMEKRSADQVAEDKDLSLFVRVSYRYIKNRSSLVEAPWASQFNRVSTQRK